MADIGDMINQAGPAVPLLQGGALAVSALIGGLIAGPGLLSRRKFRGSDERLADFLPFEQLLESGDIIRCEDGTLISVVALDGAASSSMSRKDQLGFVQARQHWVDSFAGLRCQVRIVTLKRPAEIPDTLADEDDLRRAMMDEWHQQFGQAYTTRHYIVIAVSGSTERAVDILREQIEKTIGYFERARPRVLGTRIGRGPESESELLTFWAEIIDPTQSGPLQSIRTRLRERLSACSLEIDNETGLLHHSSGNGQDKYSYIVAVPVWPEAAREDTIRRLLAVPGEMLVHHRFSVWDDMVATARYKDAEKQILSVGRSFNIGGSALEDQFQMTQAMLEQGSEDKQSFGRYQMLVHVYGNTPEQAGQVRDLVFIQLRDMKLRVQVEREIPTPLYFTLFPGYDQMVRAIEIPSRSIAQFLSTDTPPSGMESCDWGPSPWMIFATEAQTPYRFTPHASRSREAAGHMLVLGPTGSGKSVLVGMLATAALRFPNSRVFILDRDYSYRTWCLAMDAAYLALLADLPGARRAALQPFQLPVTQTNESHLVKLLGMMTGLVDSPFRARFSELIVQMRGIPQEARNLETINTSLGGNAVDLQIRSALSPWVSDGVHAGVFGSPLDTVDMRNRITAFDLTRLARSPQIAAPVITDIFHRIEQSLEEDALARGEGDTPALIIFEESSAYLTDKTFREQYIDFLERGRKKRIVVVTVAQRANSFDQISPELGDIVRSQSPTRWYFRDQSAQQADFEHHDFSQQDWRFIQGLTARNFPYSALLKKRLPEGIESVILNLDDRHFGDYAGLLRSGRLYFQMMQKAFETRRDDPLGEYLNWFALEGRSARAKQEDVR